MPHKSYNYPKPTIFCPSYRHIEPEHLGPNFIWGVGYALIIYHTKGLSLSFPVPRNSYIGDIILAMKFGENLSSEKESECFGGRA